MAFEFEFEKQAMSGKPMPKRLDIADSCAYMALKSLYAMYKNGMISRKDAVEEKNTIVYNWKENKSKIEFLNRQSEKLRERIGAASFEWAKNPTIENGDKLYAAFYNISENWRLRGNK